MSDYDNPDNRVPTVDEQVRGADDERLHEWAHGPVDEAPAMPQGPDMERLRAIMTPDEFQATLRQIERDNRRHASRVERKEKARAEIDRRAEVAGILRTAGADRARTRLRDELVAHVRGRATLADDPDVQAARAAMPPPSDDEKREAAKAKFRSAIRGAIVRGIKAGA